MSLDVGGLWVLDAGAAVCGWSPVRTIGGWRRVEMARRLLDALALGLCATQLLTILPCLLNRVGPAAAEGRVETTSYGGHGTCHGASSLPGILPMNVRAARRKEGSSTRNSLLLVERKVRSMGDTSRGGQAVDRLAAFRAREHGSVPLDTDPGHRKVQGTGSCI